MLPRNKSIFHIEEEEEEGEEEEEEEGERKRIRDHSCNLKGLQILIIDLHSSFDRNNSSDIGMNCPSLLPVDGGRRRRRRRTREEDSMQAVFLKACFLCRKELAPGKDVYMYRGEHGFCSEACRSRQILLDETREMMEVNSLTRRIRPSRAAPPPPPKIQESDQRWRILAVSSSSS